MSPIQIQKLHSLTGHKDCLYALEKRNHSEFFSAGSDGMIVLWNLESPENGQLIANIPSTCYALCYLPEHDILIVGQNFDGIQLIDVTQKKVINSLKLTDSSIFDIKFENNRIYVACGNGEVVEVDFQNFMFRKTMKYSKESVRTLSIDTQANKLLMGSSDSKIRSINLENYQMGSDVVAHEKSVFTLARDETRNVVLSGSRDAHLKVWNSQTMSLKKDIIAHMYAINHIVFSPTNEHFVTCSMDKSIKVWDASQYRLLKVIDKARHAGHGTSVNKLVWMEFNGWLVSCSDDRTISVWDINFGS